jgi:hypothetical protein
VQRKKEMIDKVKQAVNERDGSDSHVIDFTKNDAANPNLNSVMTVERQLSTLKAIQEYNGALKGVKKKKESLPEIKVHGVTANVRITRDYKKKDRPLIKGVSYKQIGITEGYLDNRSVNQDMFSIAARTQAIQRSASMQKLEKIRKHVGHYVN